MIPADAKGLITVGVFLVGTWLGMLPSQGNLARWAEAYSDRHAAVMPHSVTVRFF